MAVNPVNAFLQGFQAVDNLETNRQNRQIREENHSRMKTLWDRQDQVWERGQLEQYRADSLVKFDGHVQTIVAEYSAEGEKIKAKALAGGATEAEAEAAQGDYLNLNLGQSLWTDGKPSGFVNIANEAMKRMITIDPDFGEHVSRALGIDPTAGAFVNDFKSVAGIMLIPPEGDPAGVGGATPIFNTINDQQPATRDRSARPNDPVSMIKVGMGEMTGVFGAGVMKNEVRVAGLMREMTGVKPTGAPTAEIDKKVQAGTDAAQQAGAASAQLEVDAINEQVADIQGGGGQQEAEANLPIGPDTGGHAPATGSNGRPPINAPDIPADSSSSPSSLSDKQERQAMEDDLRSKAFGAGAEGLPASTRVASGIRLLASQTLGTVYDVFKGGIRHGGTRTKKLQGEIDQVAGFIADTVYEVATGKPPETQGEGIDAKGTVEFLDRIIDENYQGLEGGAKPTTAPVTNVGEVNKVTGGNAKDYTADNFTEPSETAARTVLNTPPPGTVEGAQAAAASLQQPVRGKQPNVVQVYNAVSLMNMGVITPTQLANYTATGQLNAAAKAKINIVTDSVSGISTVFFDGIPGLQQQTGVGTSNKARTEEDRFDTITKFSQDKFLDSDGNKDLGQLERFRTEYDSAALMLGNYQTIPSRIEVNRMAAGQNLIDNFSADPSQTVDFAFWTDPELGSGNLALGYLAHTMDLSGESANEFLFDYGITYRKAMRGRVTPENLMKDVVEIENEVNALLQGARDATLTGANEKYNGIKTRDNLRNAIVKQSISEILGN